MDAVNDDIERKLQKVYETGIAAGGSALILEHLFKYRVLLCKRDSENASKSRAEFQGELVRLLAKHHAFAARGGFRRGAEARGPLRGARGPRIHEERLHFRVPFLLC